MKIEKIENLHDFNKKFLLSVTLFLFQDTNCNLAPADFGSCNVVPGVCMVPKNADVLCLNSSTCTSECKGPSTLIVSNFEECYYECSVFQDCQNFTYSVSNKTCILMANEGTKTWDPTGDCQSGGKVLPQPLGKRAHHPRATFGNSRAAENSS